MGVPRLLIQITSGTMVGIGLGFKVLISVCSCLQLQLDLLSHFVKSNILCK